MLGFLVNLTITLFGLILGGYILLFGRQALWATLGIIALALGANVLSIVVAGGERGSDLIQMQAWWLAGVALLFGVLGGVLGRYRPNIAAEAIGLVAGADAALWLFEIAEYVLIDWVNLSSGAVDWFVVALIVVGGLLGVWLVRWDREGSLILLSVVVAVELIHDMLRLSDTSALSAIIVLALALVGVLVQYGLYLREKGHEPGEILPGPVATGLAYFQDLELD